MPLNKEELKRRWEKTRDDRTPWESVWQDIADLCYTNREFTTEHGQGQRRRRKVFDNTASQNLVKISAAFHGMFMNPQTQWFNFQPENPDLRRDREIKTWSQEVARRMLTFLNSPRIAFPQHSHTSLMDIMAFGTGPQTFVRELGGKFDYQSRSLQEFYLEPDENGNVWGYFRRLKLTIAEIERKFPDATLPSQMRNQKGARRTTDRHDVIHAVYPREDQDIQGALPSGKPWASYYFIPDRDMTVLSEGGYDEVPFFTPRWLRASNEVYGRGICGDIIADIAMLQQVRKVDIEAKEGAIRPPIVAAAYGMEGDLLTHPGSITYTRQGTRPADAFATIQLGDPRISAETLAQERDGINRGMMMDLLELPDLSRMTATEVMERTGQNMAFLSPMLSRLTAEWLDPMIGRCFEIMTAEGKIPPPPPQLEGEIVRPEYVSFIGAAQKRAESQNITQMLRVLEPFAAADPGIMKIFNPEGLGEYLSDRFDVPTQVTRSPEDIQAMEEQEQQEQAQLAQAQQAQAMASAAKDGADALATSQGVQI